MCEHMVLQKLQCSELVLLILYISSSSLGHILTTDSNVFLMSELWKTILILGCSCDLYVIIDDSLIANRSSSYKLPWRIQAALYRYNSMSNRYAFGEIDPFLNNDNPIPNFLTGMIRCEPWPDLSAINAGQDVFGTGIEYVYNDIVRILKKTLMHDLRQLKLPGCKGA